MSNVAYRVSREGRPHKKQRAKGNVQVHFKTSIFRNFTKPLKYLTDLLPHMHLDTNSKKMLGKTINPFCVA